jgi:hypothetical protein
MIELQKNPTLPIHGVSRCPSINFFNVDCIEFMKSKPDKCYDLAIVDPPYGISVNMNMGKKKGEVGRYDKKGWDSQIPPPFILLNYNELVKTKLFGAATILLNTYTLRWGGLFGIKKCLKEFHLVILKLLGVHFRLQQNRLEYHIVAL